MTLSKRLVARLDIKGNRLIKGIRFEGLRVVGEPLNYVRQYAESGVDEILFIDAVASLYGRNSLAHILRESTRSVFIPITAGGGIRSVEDAFELLSAGADKVAVNSEALKNPGLITQLAYTFGTQCVVSSIQARRVSPNKWEAMLDAGREKSGIDVLEWVDRVQSLGAGEILLTSVDQDGTCAGPDHELLEEVSKISRIPLIFGGGYSTIEDLDLAYSNPSVYGISVGAALHKSILTPQVIKNNCSSSGNQFRKLSKDLDFSELPSSLSSLSIGVIDYGMGNQQSLCNALSFMGSHVVLTSCWDDLSSCDILMLPGVGAFPEGIKQLKQRGLFDQLKSWVAAQKPLIGICLGMQMLFSDSDEFELTEGLSLLPGSVRKMSPLSEQGSPLPLPHIGWNKLSLCSDYLTDHYSTCSFYFVHSYAAADPPIDCVLAYSVYGSCSIPAVVVNGSALGFQFHPERSGMSGLHLLASSVLQLLSK